MELRTRGRFSSNLEDGSVKTHLHTSPIVVKMVDVIVAEVDPGRNCLADIQLRCLEGGECLSRTQWCNFWPDCEGGEDEERCGKSTCY